MSEILVRFVQGKGWDSKLIEWRTCAWCSHVEAILPGERTIGAMLNGGVAIRKFSDKCYRDVKRVEIWSVPCTQEQKDRYYNFQFAQLGKPYDWRLITRLAIGVSASAVRKWKEPDSWICSEVQAGAADVSIFPLPDELPGNRITPILFYGMIVAQPGATLALQGVQK